MQLLFVCFSFGGFGFDLPFGNVEIPASIADLASSNAQNTISNGDRFPELTNATR